MKRVLFVSKKDLTNDETFKKWINFVRIHKSRLNFLTVDHSIFIKRIGKNKSRIKAALKGSVIVVAIGDVFSDHKNDVSKIFYSKKFKCYIVSLYNPKKNLNVVDKDKNIEALINLKYAVIMLRARKTPFIKERVTTISS